MNYGNIAAEEMVVIRGQVFPPEDEKISKDGLPVVLLKFILNDQGELSTDGPVARIQTTDSGKFKFDPMLLSHDAAYRIGSRFAGNLVSSEFFFLTPGQTEANIHLVIPRVSETTEKLKVTNAALFIDAGLGHLQVTEVLTVTSVSLPVTRSLVPLASQRTPRRIGRAVLTPTARLARPKASAKSSRSARICTARTVPFCDIGFFFIPSCSRRGCG